MSSWQFWALLAAAFAALTAVFAKVGVENIDSDLATFVRTVVILVVLGGILSTTNAFQALRTTPGKSYLSWLGVGLIAVGGLLVALR